MIITDATPFLISIKLAAATTVLLFFMSFPLASFLVYSKNRLRGFIETLATLPLVLPPTVLGFYILLAISPRFFPGMILRDVFGVQLLFTFQGIVVASCIASLPFMVLPLKNGLASIDRSLIEASLTLGKSRLETLGRIILPNMKPFILSAVITTFAHTMGAFGVVLMIGGNIPGVTKVASIAIYEAVEELNYPAAHSYSAILLAISVLVLVSLQVTARNTGKGKIP